MNPNDKVVDDFRKDDDGNIIGCPNCGARSMRKDGFSYFAITSRKRTSCIKNSLFINY